MKRPMSAAEVVIIYCIIRVHWGGGRADEKGPESLGDTPRLHICLPDLEILAHALAGSRPGWAGCLLAM